MALCQYSDQMVFQVGVGTTKCWSQDSWLGKVVNSYSFAETAELITSLPRGWAYFISENVGRVVRIHAFEERMARWHQRHTRNKLLGIR